MGARLILNTVRINKRFNDSYSLAQKWLDNEVLKDCDEYVPFRTGNLRGSGIRGTVVGSGTIEYNAPYAKANYYALNRNFSKEKHPKASPQWFEKAKAVNKDKWINGAKKLAGGG